MARVTGKYEKTIVAGEEVRAFLPHPLPPRRPALQVDVAADELLRAAREGLARLTVAGDMVPSIEWLVYALVRKEAVLSSQIEGTQATLVDLLTFETTGADKAREDSDVVEVCNYLEALSFARAEIRRVKGLPISVRLLNQIHRRLMAGPAGVGKQPGRVRRSQNWIGGTRPGNATFVPPPPHALADALSAFERYLHAEERADPLVRSALLHAQFETIHPYLDGNGRVGRLLITLLLEHWGLLSQPMLYLSLFFKQHREEYYRRLAAIRSDGDWERWVAFFLEGVRATAEETTVTVRDLFALVSRDRDTVLAHPATSLSAMRLFEELPKHPVVTVAKATDLLGATKPTAAKAIDALVSANVLVESTGRRRDRLFGYVEYLDRLREGTEPEVG